MLRSLHRKFGMHSSTTELKLAKRQKYNRPNIALLSDSGLFHVGKVSWNHNSTRDWLTHPFLQNPGEYATGPEDAMQIVLVPELFAPGGCENNLKVMHMFSRYVFNYPTTSQDAKKVVSVIISITTKHAYLPKTIISEKGSTCVCQVIKEVADILGITLKHASTKHEQTNGMLERTHASLKKELKIETGEGRSMCHIGRIVNRCYISNE